MRKGQTQSEETKTRLREARKAQRSSIIGRHGVTQESYDRALAGGLRWCAGECKAFLDADEFYARSNQCKRCTAKAMQRFRDSLSSEEREALAEYHRQRRRGERPAYPLARKLAPTDKSVRERRNHYSKKYGVTLEWYVDTLASQAGTCAICGASELPNGQNYFCVDHDHDSGKARGLLCTPCNHALERIEAVPGWGERALAYLAKYA